MKEAGVIDRLLRRSAHRSRPDHPPDGRPGPQGDADVGRRHHLERTRLDRRRRRRRHADDLPAGSAQRTRTPPTPSRSSATPASSRKPTRSTPTRPSRSSPTPPRRRLERPDDVAEAAEGEGSVHDRHRRHSASTPRATSPVRTTSCTRGRRAPTASTPTCRTSNRVGRISA